VHVNYSIWGWVGASNNDPAQGFHILKSGNARCVGLQKVGTLSNCCSIGNYFHLIAVACRVLRSAQVETSFVDRLPTMASVLVSCANGTNVALLFRRLAAILSVSMTSQNCGSTDVTFVRDINLLDRIEWTIGGLLLSMIWASVCQSACHAASHACAMQKLLHDSRSCLGGDSLDEKKLY